MKVIHVISSPRNISTALMYSFAQRTDVQVADEPFYACYFLKTGVVHPGREEVIRTQAHTGTEVLAGLFEQKSPVLFIKNMAHHLEVIPSFPYEKCVNIFLIRNPKQIIASYTQVIEQPTLQGIGIAFQYTLFIQLAAQGITTIVLDSGMLLQHPEKVLTKVCALADIPFDPNMLQWKPGPKPYDGVWAPYWYANVHRSAGFEKQPTSDRPLPAHLNALYEEARGYYEKLLPFAVTPE
jgi:hypothetical protein